MACDDMKDSFLESRYEHYRELGKNEKQSQELAWDDYWNEAWEEYDYQVSQFLQPLYVTSAMLLPPCVLA